MPLEDLDLSTPPTEAVLENRIGLVMYGGISLAIYMYGVAEELYRLVTATAVDEQGNYLWKWSARAASNGSTGDNPKESSSHSKAVLQGTAVVYRQMAHSVAGSRHISPKFVVDILTGTSAGGLNAMFLGKALAQGKSLEPLRRLWIEEGDISRLLDDAKSYEGLPGLDRKNPRSLLNSQRMYAKLVEALDEMDGVDLIHGNTIGSLAEELDVHMTATDLVGRPVPIHLGSRRTSSVDSSYALELDHRAVFHFRHSHKDKRTDFEPKNNPFLAFVGRCTSSIVPAFEPMRVKDAMETLRSIGGHRRLSISEFEAFYPQFYKDYWRGITFLKGDDQPAVTIAEAKLNFHVRSFGDGGYLDNKPFGHAFQCLRQRRADTAVRRVVFYLEPHPQENSRVLADGLLAQDEPVNAILHGKLALTLPLKQTIHERVTEMRRLSDQATRIRKSTLHAAMGRHLPPFMPYLGPISTVDLEAYPLTLYLESTLDLLAGILSDLLGFGSETPLMPGLRTLVLAGLSLVYNEGRNLSENPIAVVSVLEKFDHGYFTRAYEAIRIRLEGHMVETEASSEEKRSTANVIRELNSAVLSELNPEEQSVSPTGFVLSPESLFKRTSEAMDTHREGGEWRSALSEEERSLIEALLFLRIRIQDVFDIHRWGDSDAQPFDRAIRLLLEAPNRQESTSSSRHQEVGRQFTSGTDALAVIFRSVATIMGLLPRWFALARFATEHKLMDELIQFPSLDAATYPILYGSGLPDSYALDLVRISPGDAISLRSGIEGDTAKKLSGIAYGHFGAFFSKVGRILDILWGRLDAAEIILNTYAEPGDLDTLLVEAQLAIVSEALVQLGELGLNPEEQEQAQEAMNHIAKSIMDRGGETA